jgi:F-type H+-transporting ATPase subunit b
LNTSFITLLAADEPGKIIGFGIDLPWDLMLQWLSLIVIVVILYKLLFKPVTEFLDKRKEGIAKTIDEAKGQKATALGLKADYEAKLTHIEEEASQILKDTRAKALVREEEIIRAAKEEAEAIKAKALTDMKLERERIKDELKKEMIEVSTLMAGKFVKSAIDETKHNEFIDEIIKEMGDVQWLN